MGNGMLSEMFYTDLKISCQVRNISSAIGIKRIRANIYIKYID